MSDLRLEWDPTTGADLAIDGTVLGVDAGLATAVLLSLGLDRRADADDVLPDASSGFGADRRGWWGDAYLTRSGDTIGSRLWLLRRSKLTRSTIQEARSLVSEALRWMTEVGIADRVDVQASVGAPGRIDLVVTIVRASHVPAEYRFAWDAMEGLIRG